jgi:hypothetical protein
MKQLRPVINRIIKKIPDAKLEALLTALVAQYPNTASQAQTDALLASIKREAELEKKLLDYTEEATQPPNGGTTTEENSLSM